MKNAVFQALAEAARRGEPVVLGIISGVKGSSPQKVGAKALFYADGRIKGTLGGGCLEAEIQQRAVESLRTGQASTFDLLLNHDFGWDDGLICGGKVLGLILPNAERKGEKFWTQLADRATTVNWGVQKDFTITSEESCNSGREEAPFLKPETSQSLLSSAATNSNCLYLETVTPPCALWIAGAGHIAQAVAPLALQLDFAVTVFDDRPALANHQYFPREAALQADVWEKLLALPLPEVPSFALIVTRGH